MSRQSDDADKMDKMISSVGLTASDLARALASMRQRGAGMCVVCGTPVEGVIREGHLHKLYCSERCRKAAYRARKKSQDVELTKTANSTD